MNRLRTPDHNCPVEITPPPLDATIPSDDELDELCDRSMRIDEQEQADPSRAA